MFFEVFKFSDNLRSLVIASCIGVGGLAAVETQPVKVLTIDSGLRLTVAASLGGLPVPVPVQLEHIAIIGDAQFSKQMLADLCPVGSSVILRVPDPELKVDSFGIVHAVVVRDFAQAPDPAQARTGPFPGGEIRCVIQIELARAGWAIADPKTGQMPFDLAQKLHQAERESKVRKLGNHSLPAVVAPGSDIPRSPVAVDVPASAAEQK